MTPVLLDHKSIFRAGVTIAAGMAVVFSLGFYIGHQKAAGTGVGFNKTIALALPKPAHADAAELEPRQPEAPSPGADIDVDSPDAMIATEDSAGTAPTGDAEAMAVAVSESSSGGVGQAVASQDSQPLQLASLGTTAALVDAEKQPAEPMRASTGADLQQHTGRASVDQAGIADTATAEDARYTIQVGVFADAENALRRQAELEAKKLSAYIDGYSNKRDELRFIVRFGYFRNKSGAVAALEHFENKMAGSGYVARVRRD